MIMYARIILIPHHVWGTFDLFCEYYVSSSKTRLRIAIRSMLFSYNDYVTKCVVNAIADIPIN